MSRRLIIPRTDIYRRRAGNWEWHYKNHLLARQVGLSTDTNRVLSALRYAVPPPEMQIDASIVEGLAELRGIRKALDSLSLTYQSQHLMCIWYWQESAWDQFVEQYEKLPDVYEDYYLFYDADRDAVLLKPLSSKPKKSPICPGTTQVQLGTSPRVVPEEG